MKSKILLFVFSLVFCFSIDFVNSQPPPPGNHGSEGDEAPSNGGGAPIAGGIGILVAMGAAYGARKWYLTKKEE